MTKFGLRRDGGDGGKEGCDGRVIVSGPGEISCSRGVQPMAGASGGAGDTSGDWAGVRVQRI